MKSIKLSLLASLLLMAMQAFGLVYEDQITDRLTPVGPGSAGCAKFTEGLSGNIVSCCAGLLLDSSTNKCVDKVLVDPVLRSCGNDSECSDGMGCFDKDQDDMFSTEGTEVNNSQVRSEFHAQMAHNTVGVGEVGGSCRRAIECRSYSCVNAKCVAAKICRYARANENVGAHIKCETGLEKAGTLCRQPATALTNSFLNVGAPIRIDQRPGTCQFNFSDNLKAKAEIAIKTMRTVEMMFALNTAPDNKECMGIGNYINSGDNVDKNLIKERRQILQEFSAEWKQFESDFTNIINATTVTDEIKHTKGTGLSVKVDGVMVSEEEVADRAASGHDGLRMLIKRNEIFIKYEKKMKDLVVKYYNKISPLTKSLDEMPNHDATSWKIGNQVTVGQCGRVFTPQIKRQGFGRPLLNDPVSTATLTQQNLLENIAFITGEEIETIKLKMKGLAPGGRGYVISPPINIFRPEDRTMLAGKNNLKEIWVNHYKRLASKPESIYKICRQKYEHDHIWDDTFYRDCRCAGEGCTCDTGSSQGYVRTQKTCTTDLSSRVALTDFVFEPEVLPLTARKCLDQPNSGDCAPFTEMIDEMSDTALAYYLTWSYHSRPDYKFYFNDARTWRRQLMHHLENRIMETSKYYSEMTKFRTSQNECINRLFAQIDRTGGGIQPGAANYFEEGSEAQEAMAQKPDAKKKNQTRKEFKFDLNSGLNAVSGETKSDRVESYSTGGAANLNDAHSATMAKRVKEMNEINSRAMGSGLDLSKKDANANSAFKNLTKSMMRSGLGTSASGGSANSDSSSQNSSTSTNPGSSSKNELSGSDSENNNTSATKGSSTVPENSVSGMGMNASSGYSSSSSSQNYSDPTGMSDEQKETLMKNRDRNRSEYETNDSDNLFEVVSKAYVRSLDKILTKKRVEE